MKDLSLFQLVVLGVCGFLVLAGVIVFATYSRSGSGQVGTIVIWGTLPQHAVDTVIQNLRNSDSSFLNVSYVERPASTYDADLLNAIASGRSPDLAVISVGDIEPFEDKLSLIPYAAVSQSAFQSAFVGEGDLFLVPQGILAMPFTLDPLVMYWNTDLFSAAGIAQPPQHWDELLADTPRLTTFSAGKNILKSAVAMGAWSNVSNAKAVYSALAMQAGDPIVSVSAGGTPIAAFGTQPDTSIESPASSALRFYTDFADPSKTSYSWNRTLPLSQEAFAAGDLAVYIGFASEYPAIKARNPNLNFQVAPLPQAKGEATPITYGDLTGLAIPRSSRNYRGAVIIAEKLTAALGARDIAAELGLPPVRRDLLEQVPNNATQTAYNQSALIARGWLDPDPAQTSAIWQRMVESVLSGQNQPSEAVAQAALAFRRLFPQ